MADLIDRQTLVERHCEGCTADVREVCKNDPICASLMWVVEEPAVDAVEVVRCQDCKNYGDEYFCPLRSLADYTDPHDYCSMGERRKDDA